MATHRTAECQCGQTNRDTTKSLVCGGRVRLILVEAGLATGRREFEHVLGRGREERLRQRRAEELREFGVERVEYVEEREEVSV